MDFTWRHIFLLAERMLSLSIAAIAKKLIVDPSTINRHMQENDSSCFHIKVDVYNCLFAPSKHTTETPEDRLVKLKKTLTDDCFPVAVRDLQFDDYKSYIRHLIKLAEVSDEKKESKQRTKQDMPTAETPVDAPSAEAPTQENKTVATEVLWGIPSDDDPERGGSSQEKGAALSSQVSDIRNIILSPEDVNMPDDFFDGIIRYKIVDFFELNLMDWIRANSLGGQRRPDIMALVQSATNFVMHMDIAINIKLTESAEENAHILREIDSYINYLRKYIGFLQNSVADPLRFIAGVYADQKAIDEAIAEFERKAAEYRADLQSQYKKIDDCIDHSLDQFRVYAAFDGFKYSLKKQ